MQLEIAVTRNTQKLHYIYERYLKKNQDSFAFVNPFPNNKF